MAEGLAEQSQEFDIAEEKQRFFERMDDLELALTYDDVRMRTRSGSAGPLPDVIDVQSKFSENVGLRVPFVSAAMDTVTDSNMAIAMAKFGGLGVIHGAMPIESQRAEVRRVKYATNEVVTNPVMVPETATLAQVLKMREDRRFDFKTFPVTNSDGKFAGIINVNDAKYIEDNGILIRDMMKSAEDVVVAPAGTTLQEAYDTMRNAEISMLPIIDEAGRVKGLYLFSDVSRNIHDSSSYNVDEKGRLRVAAAISTGKDALERVDAIRKYTDVVVIDTADGDSYYAFETLKAVKKQFPNLDVVVGNISDGPSARELAEAGANGIKVGQGPGSICSTRRETGIGMPQVTAVYDCVRALGKEYAHIPVCADGGITEHGDIPIAFAAGAHNVMMGKKLAGTTEAPGEVVTLKDNTRVKMYRGMGSASALKQNESSRERYFSGSGLILPEGVESYVPFEGSVEEVLGLCLQALRKGMRYTKAPNITNHRNNTLLRRITTSGLRESHPHDVAVIK